MKQSEGVNILRVAFVGRSSGFSWRQAKRGQQSNVTFKTSKWPHEDF